MSNRLKMATMQSILSLYEKRWSYRRIARAMGIHRETVSRYVRLAAQTTPPAAAAGLAVGAEGPKPANAPMGSSAFEGLAEPANAPIGSAAPPVFSAPSAGRQSACEPWRELILAKHAQGLSAQRPAPRPVGQPAKRLQRLPGRYLARPRRGTAGHRD
jgi:hypothetical protein